MKIRELPQICIVDSARVASQDATTALSNPGSPPSSALKQPCTGQVVPCPRHPVVESSLPSTRNWLHPLFRRQIKLISQGLDQDGLLMLPTISGNLQQWEHQRLIIRNSHCVTLLFPIAGAAMSILPHPRCELILPRRPHPSPYHRHASPSDAPRPTRLPAARGSRPRCTCAGSPPVRTA